jgi:hypothetical protein
MIIIICGNRDAESIDLFEPYTRAIHRLYDRLLKNRAPHHLIVIEGGQRGVDFMAGREAVHRGCGWVTVPANWTRYGLGAGPLRNEWMLQLNVSKIYGLHHDWTNSKGTTNCLTRAESMGIRTKRITVKV